MMAAGESDMVVWVSFDVVAGSDDAACVETHPNVNASVARDEPPS
ncbi:hypothetical protein RRSWK_05903 [Rhodopirellula sp. SWK7]|nr:hypothetical protein RRSWK_05903 [Rhodopirellula sp. SWK7]